MLAAIAYCILVVRPPHLVFQIRLLVAFKKNHMVVGFKFLLGTGKHHGSSETLVMSSSSRTPFSNCCEKHQNLVAKAP